jgi:hypothetical protein
MPANEEIPQEDFRRCASQLREAVDLICESPAFRTSLKSREFLRYVVDHTLSGEVDVLKERLIGMTLLGRDASYDTGADACVRVRANDVRKRLTAYYKSNNAAPEFSIELPPGSYVPRFFRQNVAAAELEQDVNTQEAAWAGNEWTTPISIHRLAMPTLVALFLCTICLRWQLTQEHPFTTFWQDVFLSHRAMLYLPPSTTRGGQDSITMPELKAAAPLFNLAGQFHTQFTVVNTLTSPGSGADMFVVLGAGENDEQARSLPSGGDRLVVEGAAGQREIVDRDTSEAHLRIAGRAALLTIDNGAPRFIRIDGTDEAAIDSVVEMLCERASFPEGLADSFQPGTVVQVVFPLAPRSEAIIVREPLTPRQIAADRPLPRVQP